MIVNGVACKHKFPPHQDEPRIALAALPICNWPDGGARVSRTEIPGVRRSDFSPADRRPIRRCGSPPSPFAAPLSGVNLAHGESRRSLALSDSWRIARAGGRYRKGRCGMTAETLPRFEIA